MWETQVWSPGWEEGNGNPPQYSCLENPMDGGAWQATVHGGVVTKSLTRLNDFTFKHSGLSEQLPELSVLVSFPGYVPCISQALCSISPGKKQISVFWNTWYTLFASSPRTLKTGTLLCSAGKILRRGRIDLVGLLRIYVIFWINNIFFNQFFLW